MDGATVAILNHIRSLGYAVSEFRLPSSLHGFIEPAVEMHAVELARPQNQHIARVTPDEGAGSVYRCACVLAEMVSIELQDG